jgi:hypothetical protein
MEKFDRMPPPQHKTEVEVKKEKTQKDKIAENMTKQRESI